MSKPIFLVKCQLYQMEAFMREVWGNDHISVGMRRPSGEYERPILGTRLFWTKPGNLSLLAAWLIISFNLTIKKSRHETYAQSVAVPFLSSKYVYKMLRLIFRSKYADKSRDILQQDNSSNHYVAGHTLLCPLCHNVLCHFSFISCHCKCVVC